MYSTAININGTLTQNLTGSLSADPTHSSIYGEGGWRAVATYSEIANIPNNHIIDGMAVFVIDKGQLYTYDDGSWIRPILFGDADFTNPSQGNILYYNGTAWFVGTLHGSFVEDESITTDKLANNSITSIKIADDSILSGHITPDAVTTDAIRDYSITVEKIEPSYEYTIGKFINGSPTAENYPPVSGHFFATGPAVPPDGNDYLYVNIGDDTWKRVALSTF